MKFVNKNLYENIIHKNALISDKLRIVSGFASPQFSKKILDEYPHLLIDLFIGMTPHGLSEKNYDGFKELMEVTDRIKVYYQVELPVTHIKLYEFSKNKKIIGLYTGSANFTFNGFSEWHEGLVEFSGEVNSVFARQIETSIIANSEHLKDNLLIIEEETSLLYKFNEINNLIAEDSQFYNQDDEEKLENKQLSLKRLYHSKVSQNSFEEIDIPVLYENSKKHSSINNDFIGKKVFLNQANGTSYEKIFPLGKKIELLTDDGIILHAKIPKNQARRLYFDGNFREYLALRMNLDQKTLLTWNHLLNYGRTDIKIYKENENHFLLDFHQPD